MAEENIPWWQMAIKLSSLATVHVNVELEVIFLHSPILGALKTRLSLSSPMPYPTLLFPTATIGCRTPHDQSVKECETHDGPKDWFIWVPTEYLLTYT